ncbi:TonB-dependent receptor [Flavobacterium jejuense]|uniref:TonB-dependent receptor n=2 Tax=Flavobacterium jejuense TaxID=1544455 RepID=A0ABX0ITF7_9FLAO|nr:TonB-dependent receptor [Flavobacterium jejuense]
MNMKLLIINRQFYSIVLFLFLSFFLSQEMYSQNGAITIKGEVIDSEDKLPIPGVNIIEKGTKNGQSTNFDGAFELRVSNSNATLIVTYVGYKTQEVKLSGQSTIKISLIQDTAKLDEVILVGYGTSKKSDLTGSVASVSSEEILKRPVTNVAEALTGQIAGVKITSSEGSPDADINIRIRGGGSLSQDASPLYIVDGFPVTSISDISPSNIENITVLKDASSTAIYGSRGAYGVILITTKGGTKGNKIEVSYNTFTGFNKIRKTLDVLGSRDYVNWQYEYAQLTDDVTSFEDYLGSYSDISQYDNTPTTNWQSEIFGRTGIVQNHDLGIRGGSDKINYNFDYTHYNLKGIMVGSDYKRDNLSLRLKSKPNDDINLSYTVRYSNTEINGGGANEQNEKSTADSRMKHFIGYAPFDIDGVTSSNTNEDLASNLVNPFVTISDNNRRQFRRNFNMLGGVSWNITDRIQVSSDFGLDYYKFSDYRFYGQSTYYVNNTPSVENQGLPALIFSNRDDRRFRNANTLNYDFKNSLGDNHRLKILLGEETINFKSNTLTNTIHAYPDFFTFENAINLTTQGVPFSTDNYNLPEDKLVSFFGRINYDFKNRYLLTATYRADGSSKFLGKNRWGYFPSVAAAWKISEESFLEKYEWLDLLKVRVSYGKAGNNNIPVGQTIQPFQSSVTSWINNVNSYWATSNVLANPDLKWETTTTQNLGIDFEIFNGRISGTFETYKNLTNDLLLNFNTPGTGYVSQYRNMGEIQNKGIEVSLNADAIKKDKFNLSFAFNIAFNKNNINSLGEASDFGWPSRWASTAINDDFLVHVGQPLGIMSGYQSDGRYEVSDFDYVGGVYTLKPGVADASSVIGVPVSPGSMKLKDLDGDGLVTVADQGVIGNANPKHTGGIIINANYSNFDFSAGFNWSYGNDIYNASKIEHTTATPNGGQYRNLLSVMSEGNRWTNIDPATGSLVTDPSQLTALNANTSMWSPFSNYVFSDWAVEDGSFLRLNTITLGYSLPDSLLKTIGISRLRLYSTVSNVFVWTKYSGFDPEVSTRRQTPYTPGVDYSPYPKSRQLLLGLNLNF